MPYARNDDINIYYELTGKGPPIILAHGATGDSTFWTGYGYVDRLQQDYAVITFDARGHGRSDKPHDVAAYDYHLMVGDITAVMDAIGLPKTRYWGYSMGGILGLALAILYPDRLAALIAGGAAPYGPSASTEPDSLLKIMRQGAQDGADAVVAAIKELVGSITPQYEERLRRLDYRAMAAYLEYAKFHRPSFERESSQLRIPCLLYAGDADEEAHEFGQQVAEKSAKTRYFTLPGQSHFMASDATDLIVPQVLSFLSHVDK